MKHAHGRLVSLVTVLLLLSACGSATDPINSIGDPQEVPRLQNVVNVGTGSFQASPYNSASAPYMTWTPLNPALSIAILAPAPGVISTLQPTEIFITHSSRFVSRIEGTFAVSVRVGDYVAQGQTLGFTTTGTTFVRYALSANGNVICPFSFLTPTAQNEFANTLFTTTTNRQPCF